MAELVGLNVKIGAEISDLQKAGKAVDTTLQGVTKSAEKTQAAFNALGSVQSNVSKSLATTAVAAAKADSALAKGAAGSDRAGNALMNLGRIAQDAPFGFIGISNNINPLLESFQRLRAESGSLSGTLKSLAGSLLGGGGIGLAISVATGLLTVLAQKGFFKTGESAEVAKKKVDEYGSSIKSIIDNLSKEATSVSGLVAALQSDTLARQQKVTALKELQSIAPDYFGNLKVEHGLINGLTAAYGAYLNALKERFKVKALDNELDKLFNKKINLEIQLDGGAKNFLSKDAADRISRFEAQITELGGRKILEGADFTKYTEAQKKVESLANAITLLQSKNKIEKIVDNATTQDLNSVNKQIDSLLSRRSSLANFDVKFTKDPVKTTKDVKDYTDVLRQLDEELKLNQKLADIGFISSAELDDAKIQRTKAAIESILKLKKGPGVDSPIITNLIGSMQPEEIRKQLGERSAEIAKTLKTIRPGEKELLEVKVPIDLKPVINTDRALNAIDQKIRDDFNNLAKDIQKTVLNSGLANIGEVIGTAIAGGDVGGAFKGLLQTVINGMKQLGEAMIGLGTAKSALEKFNIAPGIGTIIAGIGVIALSSLIQSALPKFEGGVTGFGGGLAIVGERGPEMVRLPQGSDVIPNHRLSGVSGSGVQVFIPALTLRGSDLLVQFNRAQAQSNRRG